MANKEITELSGYAASTLLGQNPGNTDLIMFPIFNALTETVAGKVLDARQGKALKDLIDAHTTALDTKVDENAAITGATKTKITYDAKGLVTAGADATTADIADSLNRRYVTDAQQTVIGNTSGTNSGNETATTVGALINAAGAATPNDTDLVATAETGGLLKKITWTNVKAFLKTYFDTLYQAVLVSGTNIKTVNSTSLLGSGDITQTTITGNAGSATVLQTARTIDGVSFNGSANITVIAPATNAAASKTTPVNADELPIVDTESANVLKKLTFTNLKAFLKTYFDTLYPSGSGTSSGTNTGDQTSIAGITGTKSQFNTAVTDGDIVYSGDALGTPSSGNLSNCTSLPISGVTGLQGALDGKAPTNLAGSPCEFQIACSDLTTALTTGTNKAYFRAPFAFTLQSVRASVLTAPTGSTLIVDINESGSTVLSTKLSIDASEKTSTTAASAAVISDSAIADDAEIGIDIDQIGSTIAGAGLIVTLKGVRV